jgi:prepilin-type N-terminal cleavage/methylation domain-containing protein
LNTGGQRGFTLLELIVAMVLLGLMTLSIAGVVSLGAQSAGRGERLTEQSRRLRIATGIVTRQIRSVEPIFLKQDDERLPFFWGESDRVEFVTSTPQKPDASGLAMVRYWHEDGALMMSELPVYVVMAEEEDGDDQPFSESHLGVTTPLLYDVDALTFQYTRDIEDDVQWEDEWIGADIEELPAAVRISVESDLPDGPFWYHEIPVQVGSYNSLMGEEDFSKARRVGRDKKDKNDDDENDDEDDDDSDDDDFEDDDDFDE